MINKMVILLIPPIGESKRNIFKSLIFVQKSAFFSYLRRRSRQNEMSLTIRSSLMVATSRTAKRTRFISTWPKHWHKLHRIDGDIYPVSDNILESIKSDNRNHVTFTFTQIDYCFPGNLNGIWRKLIMSSSLNGHCAL